MYPDRHTQADHVTMCNTLGDSDVISVPAGVRRHLVGKTLRNDFHCDIAELHFVGKLVYKPTDRM